MAAYCTLEEVKSRLNIEATETTKDNEIDSIIAEAQAIIDDRLSEYTTTPFTTAPTVIKYACADLATAVFQTRRKAPSEPQSTFFELYELKIAGYIKAHFEKGAMIAGESE